MKKTVLVTGGCGYIGSHTAVSLLENDYDVVVIDNLSNSSESVLKRISEITNKSLDFVNCDITDSNSLNLVFEQYNIHYVIHFAGLKAVGESIISPLDYYSNNVNGTIVLLETMKRFNVNKIIFSSSATVYGLDNKIPYVETMPRGISSSPYGKSKSMIENIFEDYANTNKKFSCIFLRYFNPIGAHESSLIGESPSGIPNNLMPYITQVAAKKRDKLLIFGNDYDTPDGTCRRDYVHVMDVAEGHVKALKNMSLGVEIYNLGYGAPHSVLEVIKTFEKMCSVNIHYEFAERREGDIDEFWSDNKKAMKKLNWYPKRNLEKMIVDAWNWEKNISDKL